jgi:FlaA1/EpsC-like NDP-sugar epimerase
MFENLNGKFHTLSNLIGPVLPYRRVLIFLFHLGIFALAYLAAFGLRFEGLIPESYYATMLKTLPLVVLVQAAAFYYHDLYQGLWRYASFADVQNILRATLMSLVALFLIDLAASPYLGTIPRSIYILDSLLVVAFACGPRFLVRHLRMRFPAISATHDFRRVLLVGPVDAVEPLLREMVSRGQEYNPVAVVDPTADWRTSRMLDVPIVGGSGSPDRNRGALWGPGNSLCLAGSPPGHPERPGGKVQAFAPGLQDHTSPGGNSRRALPPGGRPGHRVGGPPPPPPGVYRPGGGERQIQGRVVLVTGAGGSIGSELCRQLAGFQPASLIMLERAENSLYAMEVELRRRFPDLAFQALVASINDGPGLEILFRQFSPHLVFHAAAYKHVPLMERCPIEAAYNNILGTRNVARAALAAGASRFVFISTDKAVNPTSVMGVTKRIAEKYVQSLNGAGSTRFIITRFGNVLGSAGSVIPIFKEQLANGGPLTVTHPEIERFFMTIPEAVQLVLQAAAMGQGGDIFVLNMGRSVKIKELAEKLILLSGRTPATASRSSTPASAPGKNCLKNSSTRTRKPRPTEHPLINRAVAALVQKKQDIAPYLDTAWTFQAIRGALLALVLFVSAPCVAAFFDTPAAKTHPPGHWPFHPD